MNKSLTTLLFLALLASATGCHHHGKGWLDCHSDYCPGAVPEPAGAKICRWQEAQVRNAEIDQTVLYRCDFVGDSLEIGPQAKERLLRLLHSGSLSNSVVVVEKTSNPNLDQERLEHVVEQLAAMGAAPLDAMIGIPPALGVSASWAERATAATGRSGRANRAGTRGAGQVFNSYQGAY